MTMAVGHAGLLPTLGCDPKVVGQVWCTQGWLATLLAIVLDPHSFAVQIVQTPGNAQGAQPITPVVEDLARDAWHGIAAEAMTSHRLEAIEGADQAHSSLLNEVVTLAIASVELTLRTKVGETQVLENSIVAFKNGAWKCSASFASAMTVGLTFSGC